jgi:hypothetical protein
VTRVKSSEFSGLIISNGEYPISTIDKAGGNQARLIEILRKPPQTGKDMSVVINVAKQVLRRNYGWCGIDIVEFYLENSDKVEDVFEDYYQRLIGMLKNGNELQDRQQPYFAAVMTGCWILRKIGVKIAGEKMVLEAIKDILSNLKPIRTTEAAIRSIESIVASNVKKFYRKGMDTSGGEDSVEPAHDGVYWGRYDGPENIVHFFPTIFDEVMRQHGFDSSILSMLHSEKRVIRKGNKLQNVLRFAGKARRVVSIKIDEDTE